MVMFIWCYKMKIRMSKWYEYPFIMFGKYFYTKDSEGFILGNNIYLTRLE